MLPELTQQQRGLHEQYARAHTAWLMAATGEDDAEAGTAYMAALDACLDAGFDPFHHPQPQ
jgi:hypothetical protein